MKQDGSELIDQLNQWLNEMDERLPAGWEWLPDIGLYMDQVQTYIDRQVSLYRRDEGERLMTSSMINNYIKDGLLPRAKAKKYGPEHLAMLIMIGTLKQVLSMQNLRRLLSGGRDAADVEELYQHFIGIQASTLQTRAHQVLEDTRLLSGDLTPDQRRALRELALQLSIEARINILIAEKILALPDQEMETADSHTKKGSRPEKT